MKWFVRMEFCSKMFVLPLLIILVMQARMSKSDFFYASTPSLVEEGKTFEISFYTNFTTYSDIVCFWDLSDNTTYQLGAADLEFSPNYHMYKDSGVYMIMIVCESQGGFQGFFSEVLVYKQLIYQMCAYRSLNLTYASDVYVLGETDLLVYYHYDFENPLYYYMEIDGSPVFENSFSHGPLQDDELYTIPMDSIPFPIELQYILGLGVHNVSVTVFSEKYATAVYCESQIKFVELVSELVFYLSDFYVVTNTPFIGSIAATSGWPAMIEWKAYNVEDRLYDFYFGTYRQARAPDEMDEVWLYISRPGNYTVSATIYHEINDETASAIVIVENPIREFDIYTNAPLPYSQDAQFEMTLNFSGDPLPEDFNMTEPRFPTDVFCDIDYGDGILDIFLPLDLHPLHGNTSLTHTYTAPGLYELQIFMYNYVSSIQHYRDVAVLEEITDAKMLSFSGETGNLTTVLPLEFPALFTVNISQGTIEFCNWMVDGVALNVSTFFLEYKFEAEGEYTIDVFVRNAFSGMGDTMTVTVIEAITGIYLINSGPVPLSDSVTFLVFLSQLGRNSSFYIDFGDGSNATLLQPTVQDDIMTYIDSSVDLPLDPEKAFSVVVNHTYTSSGVYSATLLGVNPVSIRQVTSDVFVQDSLCQVTTLRILDGDSSYSTSKHYPRSKRFQFAAEVDMDCLQAMLTTYEWSLHKINAVFPIPGPENEYPLPESVHTNLTTLYVPAFTLEYGDYVFKLEVTVHLRDGSVAVKKNDQTYASVEETPMLATIDGGSSIAVGWVHSFTVDGSVSVDPDYPSEQVGMVFSWFCRQSNETFPSNEELFLLIGESPGSGGCFGTGYLLKSSSFPHVDIPAQTLEGNQTYVFRLILSKTGRQDVFAEQTITVLPGDPPTIKIQCMVNCGLKVNPSSRLVLSAKCQDCTVLTKPTYSWSLIPDSQNNSKQQLIWYRDTTTSSTNSYLAITADTFLGSESYRLILTVSTWSGASTFAEYTFTTNSPPEPGLCSVLPQEGVVLETMFTISCEGFEDEDEPLSYEIKAMTGAEKTAGISSLHDASSAGTLIYYGVDPSIPPSNLPVGLAERDHQVDIFIKVTDTYGASVHTNVKAKVKEPEMDPTRPFETVTDTVLQLTSGEESTLNALLGSGNTQGATQLVYTLTSLLNAEAESDNEINEELNEEEKAEEGQLLEQKKTKRAEARESIIKNIRQIDVRDMETLQQTSAAIAQVTQAKDEISAEAQLSAAESYQEMSTFLKEQSESGAGGETVEETASFIMSGLSNIMEAAFTTLTTAVNRSEDSSNHTDASETMQNTRNVTLATLQALDKLQIAILQNKVPGEDHTVINTEALSLVLQRQEKWQLASSVRDSKAGQSFFQLPEDVFSGSSGINYDDIIDSHMHRYNHNPFAWSSQNGDDIMTHVTSLELQQSDGNQHTRLELTDLPTDIDIFLENEQENSAQLKPISNNQSDQFHYNFTVTSEMPYVVIEVLVTNRSLLDEDLPEIKLSLAWDDVEFLDTTFPEAAEPPVAQWNDTSNITGNPYLWIIPVSDIRLSDRYYLIMEGWEGVNPSVYTVYAYGAQCVYWNQTTEGWDTSGCKVGPLTSHSITHCQCNHLSHFAAGFVVLPNTVRVFKDAVLFTKIHANPIAAIAVGSLLGLFILLGIWARHSDKREEEQGHVIFLADNKPEAKYRYHVTVFTGMRWGAGSTAVATITLHGTNGSSDPHVLASDDSHKILQRGGMDAFILTTQAALGDLKALRVWHDNSGKSPEWHINRIMVNDLQTQESWYFICHAWLAVDVGECLLDKTFHVASSEDLHQFDHLFTTRLMRDMKDHHLWLSVFTRPRNSNFTRVQRVACCFTLLMMSMLASIMFYGVTPEAAEGEDSSSPHMAQKIRIGSVQVSWFEILVGIESGLIALPMSLLILMIFRNTRRRRLSFIQTMGIVGNKDIRELSGRTSRREEAPDATSSTTSSASRESYRTVGEDLEAKSATQAFWHRRATPSHLSVSEVEVGMEKEMASSSGETKPKKKNKRKFLFGKDQPAHASANMPGNVQPTAQGTSTSKSAFASPSGKTEKDNPPTVSRHEEYLCHHISKLYEEIYDAPEEYFKSEKERKKALKKLDKILVSHGWDIPIKVRETVHIASEGDNSLKCCHPSGCLPWWFAIVGWFLVAATNVVCAYLIILYGLSYGKTTTINWLVSMLVTLLQSTFVLQPGKVILVAAFFALVWKKHEDDDVGLHLYTTAAPGLFTGKEHRNSREDRWARYYHPPTQETVNLAKEQRRIQLKMYKMVKELLGTIILVAIALEVAHFQRDRNAFLLHQALEETFTQGFEDVSTMNDVYYYFEESFLPGLYGDTRGFLGDGKTYRVGRARLRQVRIAPGSCERPHQLNLLMNCTGTLRLPKHTDKQPYNMSWSLPLPDSIAFADSLENNPWVYTYEKESQGSYLLGQEGLYTRGGYIKVLGSTSLSSIHYLKDLQDKLWLDEYTRALYIEWTVYNGDTGLLCICTVLFEATMFGDVAASSYFQAFRPFATATVIDKVNLTLQCTYLLVILLLIYLEIKKFIKKRKEYFNFWNILNLLTIAISILATALYVVWAVSLASALETYKKNPSHFTSFYFSALIDSTFMTVTAFLVFVNTLRCAKILRYNRSILTFNNTFSCICSQFFSFTLTLVILVYAFAVLFCITFGAEARDFKDLSFSFQTIFLFLEGGYEEFMDVTDFHPRLSPVYFILMTFSLYFLLFNFFLLLIIHSFRAARHMTPYEDQRDVLAAFVDWVFSLLFIKRVKKS